MTSGKKSFICGILIGIILSVLYFQFFAPRYEVTKTAVATIRLDKWTGQSWRLVDNNWKKMMNVDEDWELIDNTLVKAISINIPEAQVDSGAALKKLRDRYPVLKDIPDYDLIERIKLVYSEKLLTNLYLRGFMDVEKAKKVPAQE